MGVCEAIASAISLSRRLSTKHSTVLRRRTAARGCGIAVPKKESLGRNRLLELVVDWPGKSLREMLRDLVVC